MYDNLRSLWVRIYTILIQIGMFEVFPWDLQREIGLVRQ